MSAAVSQFGALLLQMTLLWAATIGAPRWNRRDRRSARLAASFIADGIGLAFADPAMRRSPRQWGLRESGKSRCADHLVLLVPWPTDGTSAHLGVASWGERLGGFARGSVYRRLPALENSATAATVRSMSAWVL
jgi:hypothetical protein